MKINRKIYIVLCLLVGTLFLASGFGKAMNAGRFGNLIAQYGFPFLQNAAPVIILAEILTGICLVLFIRTKWMAAASAAMLVVFTGAYTYGYFVNHISDCGCFGSMNAGISGPWFTFGRNILLIIASVLIWLHAPTETSKEALWKKILVMVALLPMIFLTGYTFRTPVAFWEGKMRHEWENMAVRNTPVVEHIDISPDSTYIILFMSYDCFHCWNSVANFRQVRESGIVDHTAAFMQTGDTTRMAAGLQDAGRQQFIRTFGDDIVSAEIGYNDELREHITRWPTYVYVRNDTIRLVVEGELPSSLTFERMFLHD